MTDIYDDYIAPLDEFGPPWVPEWPASTLPLLRGDSGTLGRSGAAWRLTRLALGLTTNDLAMTLRVSRRTVRRWESLDHVPGWADALLQRLINATQMLEVDLMDAGNIGIRRDGFRVVDVFVVPEVWWHHLVGRVMMRGHDWDVVLL